MAEIGGSTVLDGSNPPPARWHSDPVVVQRWTPWAGIGWREIWRYRELLYFLAWRDVKVRYKQTVLGVLWVWLQPLLSIVVFAVFFGRLAGLAERTGDIPYSLFVYAGLLPWNFVSASVLNSSNSVIGSSQLITKVFFPRLIIPLSAIGAALLDLAVSALLFLALALFYRTPLSWQLTLLPLVALAATCLAAGMGSLFSALTVEYRDFRYVVPFLTQLWMWTSPVIYPPSLVPARWQWALSLNPMTGIIGGFRSCLFGRSFDLEALASAVVFAVVVLYVGASYFRAAERRFADVI